MAPSWIAKAVVALALAAQVSSGRIGRPPASSRFRSIWITGRSEVVLGCEFFQEARGLVLALLVAFERPDLGGQTPEPLALLGIPLILGNGHQLAILREHFLFLLPIDLAVEEARI